MDWVTTFKKDINRKLVESKKEYDLYKVTGSIIYLQQAGNKLFSVVENHLMVKYNTRVQSYGLVRKLVNNKRDSILLRDSYQLHKFFYNGTLQMDVIDAEQYYLSVYNKMKGRVSKNV